MRKLKTFNENISDDILQKEYVSIEELRDELDSVIQTNNFEESLNILRRIKEEYPYVKTESPYSELWNEYTNKWHDKFIEDINSYEH